MNDTTVMRDDTTTHNTHPGDTLDYLTDKKQQQPLASQYNLSA
jgi:hypothetical protein